MTNTAKTILVIEDDEQILENTVEILKIKGFNAIGAETGALGLQAALQHRPDLILSDVMMPDLDGHQLLSELRRDPQTATIPFIFMTALAQRNQVRLGMELGADDYLTKPFSSDELIAAVNTRLQRHNAIVTEAIHEQEQKLGEFRDNIIYMLPHELRTPLNHILGYTELLLSSDSDIPFSEVADMLKSIQRGGKRLYRLIENYLLYAQLQMIKADPQKQMELNQHMVGSPGITIELLSLSSAEKADRKTDLTLDITDVEAVQISTDSLHKIVNELVDNAFKFSKPGTAVHISAAVENGSYMLQITDQGRGMSSQEAENVGPLVQFQRSVYEQQGSGLGLSLAKELTELYSGRLIIDSVADKGTTIKVLLRCATID